MNNSLTNDEELLRKQRAKIFYLVNAFLFISTFLFLFWALRSLIFPSIIGAVFAYICFPAIDYLKSKGMSRGIAILILFGLFCFLLFDAIHIISEVAPDKKEELEIQVRVRYKINEKYNQVMGLSSNNKEGNIIFILFGRELTPLFQQFDKALQLSRKDQQLFIEIKNKPEKYGNSTIKKKFWNYYLENKKRDMINLKKQILQSSSSTSDSEVQIEKKKKKKSNFQTDSPLILTIFNVISLWLITPLIFLIMLFDNGKIKKSLIKVIPNKYFEVTLTVFNNVNEALGNYLRGTALECFLVGTSLAIFLFFIGLEVHLAAIIGLIAGLANAIPFLGPAIGLIVGVIYALLAEEISPILPFVNSDNFMVAVLAAVGLVQFLDNALFQPFILGGAVNLHPIVVIFGVMGGAILFGFSGMLLAIPTIMVIKVIFTTLFTQLRAYQII
jgi:predicted PurR-regulated permease PerM